MKRELKSYIFLLVCMLMQIAAVFPHHHHSEMFCLHPDLVACESQADCTNNLHHDGDSDRHTCSSACVTNFQCGTPDHHLSDVVPDYSFFIFLYPLFSAFDLAGLSDENLSDEWNSYVEDLYARNALRAFGLRAPPSSLGFC